MRSVYARCLTGCLSLALVLSGCGQSDETTSTESETASIESAIELENGGLEMADDLAAFGKSELPDLDGLDLEPNLALPELPGLDVLEGKQPMPMPPPLPCPHGGLKGKWKELKPGLGLFFGKWGGMDGKLHGHLKGIYGKNKKGEGVFFGKYINLGGKFVGLIKGRYEQGFFKGRWFDKGGLRGELGGIYGKGELKGLWHAFCPQCVAKCEPGFVPGPADPNAGVTPADPNAPVDPNAVKPEAGAEGMAPMGAPMPDPGKCLCLPPKLVPCKMGQCPNGLVCDLCPPVCKPGENCPAVCGPPVCVPKPPMPPKAPAEAGTENAPIN